MKDVAPALRYAYGVMFRVSQAPHSPYRFVGISEFCREPAVGDTVVVGGFIVTVEGFDGEGFMNVAHKEFERA